MPPRPQGVTRGGSRGGPGPPRTRPPRVGGPSSQYDSPSIGSHVTTVGVKRPNFGTLGRDIPIYVNSFETSIPENVIHHYNGKYCLNSYKLYMEFTLCL
jgi:eukaryotic translation initiation factor 2C